MKNKDRYKTLAAESTGEFRDRGSKFIAYAFPAYNESEWQERLNHVKKAHPKARHHCYAYRLGLDKNNFRTNDDGEPSGTAGRPILGQIDRLELTNVIVVVVRYFGGTLLGTSGLINAYKTSTSHSLQQATIIEKKVEDIFRLTFDYAIMSNVMNAVKKLKLEIVKQSFTETAWLDIAILKSQSDHVNLQLKALIAKIHIEEVNEKYEIDGLTFRYLCTR